jgi:hypothetical protein
MSHPSDSDTPTLLPQHARLIGASGISDAVAKARGYRSVTSKAELGRLGFGEAQRIVPALLVPIFDVRGEVALYQIRPDQPRRSNNRLVKYETPHGSRMVLDIHPFSRVHIGNPEVPLFITEGIRKADAATSICLCCIGLLGVWNWRGTNEHGGVTALPDWESIALKGRPAFIAFDSDVMLKPEVHEALSRFKTFLEGWKADVNLIYLPPAQDGSKQGLDDYLSANHTVEDLLRLAARDLRSISTEQAKPSHPYIVTAGRICLAKNTQFGPVLEPLCNFDARIMEEISFDDGETESREFMVSGVMDSGKPLPPKRVSADRFSNMSWITGSWGVDAILGAGAGKKDQLREAILLLSPEAKRRRIFAHTGWRKIGNEYLYLSATGAPGRSDLEVDLGRELARYALPRDPVDSAKAIRASLALLRIAPLEVTAALWAGVFRAPLVFAFPIDLVLWLEGITGSLKSTLAALYLCHYGSFERTTLPGAWSSTSNLLEKRAYTLKDALFVIDEFAPGPIDRRELEMKAARLTRAQGNLAGRGRLQSDLSERRTFFPRGLILSTGEQRQSGQSILARTFLLDIERKHVDLARLTDAQANSGVLPHGLAGYVTWLAPQMETMPATLRTAFEDARKKATGIGSHLRHPEALAHLWLGIDVGLGFAEEIGAVTSTEARDLRAECWGAMVARATAIAKFVEAERPTRRFAEILASLFVQRRVLVLPKDASDTAVPRDGRLIGWYDQEHLYLVPEASFQAVSQFARETGEGFPVPQQRLRQDFVKEGIANHDGGHTTVPVRIGGRVQRVVRLRIAALSDLIGEDLSIPQAPVIAVTDVTAFEE